MVEENRTHTLSRGTEQRGGDVQISYQELAENVGLSKSATQDAVRWLIKRHLLAAKKKNATAIPTYKTLTPWKNR